MNNHYAKQLTNFSDLTIKLHKLNKVFLGRIEYDLIHNDINDLTAIQALLIKNIHEFRGSIPLMDKNGYYIGQNYSYNLKSLIDKGYITKQNQKFDMRRVKLSLTKEGEKVLVILNSSFMLQNEALTKLVKNDNFIQQTSEMIDKLLNVIDKKQ